MDNPAVYENEVYCKNINGTEVCYRVVEANPDGEHIVLKNIATIDPQFDTTVTKLVKSGYVRRNRQPVPETQANAKIETPA